jgi:DNA-directed RNA polymerase subunit H (RpoH/RPB5)
MDIQKILNHSIELLELRKENVDAMKETLAQIEVSRFYNEVITVSTDKSTICYAFSKDSFKEMWSNFRSMDREELEETYTHLKFIWILQEYPPSVTMQAIQQKDQQLQEQGGYIHLFLTKELLYNPTKHELVPKHKKLSPEAAETLIQDLQLKSKAQLPFIQKQDIIARWLGLLPGDIVKITRYTETSGKYYYYRCCV